jgi:hypothetical protein
VPVVSGSGDPPRSTPGDQRQPVRRIAVPSFFYLYQDKTGVQDAHQQVGERQVVEPHAAGEPAGHGAWTAGVPPWLAVAGMDNSGTVGSWLLGQRAGEARMQADVDESTIWSEDAAGFGGKGGDVVHVGVGEPRHHQVQATVRERQPSGVGLDQRGPERSGSAPGHPELIGGRIHAHDGPACAGQSGQMGAGPAAHIQTAARARPHQAQELLSSYQSACPS